MKERERSKPEKIFEMAEKPLRIRVITTTKLKKKENKNIYTLAINLFFDQFGYFWESNLKIEFIESIKIFYFILSSFVRKTDDKVNKT